MFHMCCVRRRGCKTGRFIFRIDVMVVRIEHVIQVLSLRDVLIQSTIYCCIYFLRKCYEEYVFLFSFKVEDLQSGVHLTWS